MLFMKKPEEPSKMIKEWVCLQSFNQDEIEISKIPSKASIIKLI